MRLIGYARRSCARKQGRNSSLDIKTNRMRQWCIQNGHDLVAVLHEDESGASIAGRPVLRSVLKDNLSDGLLVTRMDRLTRCEMDAFIIKSSFDCAGKYILATDDPIDTRSPEMDTHFSLLVSAAARDYRTTIARMRAGREHAEAQGRDMTSVPGYGWKRVGIGRDSVIVQDELEQKVVALIMALLQDGLTGQAVADYLNDNEIPTRHGRKWSTVQVHRVRNNSARH